ncbi:MAG TPA: Gfo/Idh/MocA family oxidoreductase [Actinophytocola sp.]|uniref:Gfo/Idh/MocA family protein n=1 Tax=Actinophytocola sp. TaxID=1872138 RepID=UPI002DBB1C48|nr:Gfo/Idh/MocA family oxidoreductase [Actinophytocola sp.]HEU5473558.1 Gfo/Idh/MocA family oxidoreductase [Actinophytocola sp.]
MSTATQPIRVAMIGLGWVFTDIWAPMLADHPGFEVIGVLDPDPAAVARATELFAAARTLSTVDDLDPAEVDLAVVATPNHLHASTAATLLRRGIAVFVEKPVCLTSAQGAELVEAERAGGARVLAGTSAWHRADVKALRAQLDQLGPLRTVDLAWIRARGVPGAGGWLTSGDQAGGGALFDLGWHLITIGLRMIGWPPVTDVVGSVSADFVGRNGFESGWHPAGGTGGVDVEDTAQASFRTETGVFFTLSTAWASHAEADHTRITLEGADGRAELLCTFGLSPNRTGGSSLRVLRAGRTEQIEVPDEPVGAEYRRQLDLLPTLLADPNQPGAATAESVRIVDLIERIYASAGAVTAGPVPG